MSDHYNLWSIGAGISAVLLLVWLKASGADPDGIRRPAHMSAGFSLEDRTLSDFLVWVSKETGRKLVYVTPNVQRSAVGIILHGSISEMDPELALAAVMATTSLSVFEPDGKIVIGMEITAGPDRTAR